MDYMWQKREREESSLTLRFLTGASIFRSTEIAKIVDCWRNWFKSRDPSSIWDLPHLKCLGGIQLKIFSRQINMQT